jgi:uncharacterized protein YprB with RNaseH-like and TPR domain
LDDLRQELDRLKLRLREREQRRLEEEEFIEEPLAGEEVETGAGRHWEAFTNWDRHRRYGSFDISAFDQLPANLVSALDDELPPSDPSRWAFLDTETTGLAGGAGTLPFLIGVGRLTPQGFTVKQYFIRDFDEEPSALTALAADLADVELLVTYNGRSFDAPLLESRYTLARLPSPLASLPHLDLLYGARRLWKLRFESCRLVELESRILGLERQGDVAGSLIPHLYFEYLRTRRPHRLVPVFKHNVLDIVTLACLTAIVPRVFSPDAELVHAGEMLGVGRWLMDQGDADGALRLFENAMTRAEWDRLPPPRRLEALIALAKHAERKRDFAKALRMAEEARFLSPKAEHERRYARLVRKMNQGKLLPE